MIFLGFQPLTGVTINATRSLVSLPAHEASIQENGTGTIKQ